MSWKWPFVAAAVAVVLVLAVAPAHAGSVNHSSIEYDGRMPEGLVGTGHSVVRVRPDGYDFHVGGDGSGHFRLILGRTTHKMAAPGAHATFFPGGVQYEFTVIGTRVRILHGAFADTPYFTAVEVSGAGDSAALEVETHGTPAVSPAGHVRLPLTQGRGQVVLAVGAAPAGTLEELRRRLESPYATGLVLETPSPAIDRAVPFCRALLDLGFDGKMHVCEMFRWRDVWSRDLGSGLAPGAMASGRFAAAATTIDYDLGRHAKADPLGLKVTQDPSQGGSAEGVAWLTRAVWKLYVLDGDLARLRASEHTLRPWVEAWVARDADERGLLVDVTEWMDHSRFFLFPDGARVLYSNVLFAGLLSHFAQIETALGDTAAARRYAALNARFVRGINDGLWDEARGMYDNLEWWGLRDERASSESNALAVLCGVAPAARARRALAGVRERNWRAAGSTTIFPPMTHVPDYIDHNFRMWPWWNAVEARARFREGDPDGGVWLLGRCAATLEDERYPGMIEELTTPEGVTEGGNAFLSAAGSYLDGVVEGLLGVQVLEAGCARLRVAPHTPASWKDWHAAVPLPGGALRLGMRVGKLFIRSTDPRVRVIEAPAGAVVLGAARAALSPVPYPALDSLPAARVEPVPPPHARNAAVLVADSLPAMRREGAPLTRHYNVNNLDGIDLSDVDALVVTGNALPRHAANGLEVPAALAGFLNHGGALVFYGATMQDRGTMGETGGVIEWYDRRPVAVTQSITGWKFRPSMDAARVPRADERGTREGWAAPGLIPDTAWTDIEVPAPWEKHMGYDYDGWGWYRTRFTLPADARGKVVAVRLGRIDDADWTYVNGRFVGSRDNWQAIRYYRIQPADSVYGSLVFGGDNTLAVEVLDTGGGGGMYVDVPRVGVETADSAWAPIEPRNGEVAEAPVRLGTVSWGPGGRFMNSWETSRGAFGFAVDGHGAEFVGPLASLTPFTGDVREAFTDFAVSRPWRFEPLAFTQTRRGILFPDHGERYPCAARLVNTQTGGEIVLLPASLAGTPQVRRIFELLKLGGKP